MSKRSNKLFFDKQLTNISRDFIQTIFYPTNHEQQNITNPFHNIFAKKLSISIHDLDDKLFEQFPQVLQSYQLKNTSNPYIYKHFQYISQVLKIRKTDNNFKQYRHIIALAATLDEMFVKFNNAEIHPDIIHEIVYHFYQNTYEQATTRILNNIFNVEKTLTHIIKAKSTHILFRIYNDNLINISINTHISLSEAMTPNKTHNLNAILSFDISRTTNSKVSDNTLSYNYTYLNLFIPNSMKQYTTQEKITVEDVLSSNIIQNPNHAILNHNNQYEYNPDILLLNYCIPNPTAKSLFKDKSQAI
ncbi:hypothetical protein [Ehrlichia minasensis]|nr:hypothetical protein [Ehrlichia minasensis]